MNVVSVTPDHFDEVNEWLTSSGRQPNSAEFLRAPGLIIPGIAAIWVFSAPPIALIDGLVINASSPKEMREAAVNVLIRAATEQARDHGARFVCSVTSAPSVLQEAVERHGFVRALENATMLVADLDTRKADGVPMHVCGVIQ